MTDKKLRGTCHRTGGLHTRTFALGTVKMSLFVLSLAGQGFEYRFMYFIAAKCIIVESMQAMLFLNVAYCYFPA